MFGVKMLVTNASFSPYFCILLFNFMNQLILYLQLVNHVLLSKTFFKGTVLSHTVCAAHVRRVYYLVNPFFPVCTTVWQNVNY